MKTPKKLSLVLLLTFVSLDYSFAQEVEKKVTPVRFLFGGAIEYGGDEIAEILFTNGDTQSVKAGQGASVAVGAQLQIPKAEKLLIRATVGYKYATTAADNAHIRITRVPVHLTANCMITEKIRIGAGLAMHKNIRFESDGIGDDNKFNNASGAIFEIAYRGIGLIYTAMKYTDQASISYSANSIGVSLTGVLPRK
jgi:hypothetical protein